MSQFIMVIGLSGVCKHTSDLKKSDSCGMGLQFVNHEYDYRLSWMTQCPVTIINHFLKY